MDEKARRDLAVIILSLLRVVVTIIAIIGLAAFVQPKGAGQTSVDTRLTLNERIIAEQARQQDRMYNEIQEIKRTQANFQLTIEKEMSSMRGMGQGALLILGLLEAFGLILHFKKPNGKP